VRAFGRRSGGGGFTLVECVAAIVVLSIGIPPMLWALRAAHHHRVDHVMASRAKWLASEKLEDVIADRHCRGYAYLRAANYPAEGAVAGFPGFTRSVSLAETGADLTSAGIGFMRATCTVGYTDGSGVARTLSLSTVITDYTP
jgi:prepilin-type N-terminal cleavage/methylation domain-containing protein